MLEVLRSVIQEVNRASDLASVLEIIVNRVGSAMQTEVCSVYLLDESQNRYRFMATVGLNRDAVGAKLRLRSGEHRQTRVVTTGSGYLSGSSRRLHFGLGDAKRIDELVIEWPSGERTVLADLAVDRLYTIREGSEFPLEGR